MSSLEFKYQSDFARRYVAEGRAEIILELLATRFGPLPDSIQTRVRGAEARQLYAVAKRVLTAATLEEVIDSI
jgi:hypothetical protein